MRQAQLRDYTIAEGHLDDFVAAWTAAVLPLRQRHGFEIRAWTVPEESRFIWLIDYRGSGSFEDADAAYYDSDERKRIDPDPAQWIAANRTTWLEPIEDEGDT